MTPFALVYLALLVWFLVTLPRLLREIAQRWRGD